MEETWEFYGFLTRPEARVLIGKLAMKPPHTPMLTTKEAGAYLGMRGQKLDSLRYRQRKFGLDGPQWVVIGHSKIMYEVKELEAYKNRMRTSGIAS